MYCWGNNSRGQLGTGDTQNRVSIDHKLWCDAGEIAEALQSSGRVERSGSFGLRLLHTSRCAPLSALHVLGRIWWGVSVMYGVPASVRVVVLTFDFDAVVSLVFVSVPLASNLTYHAVHCLLRLMGSGTAVKLRLTFSLSPPPHLQYTPALVCKPLSAAKCVHVACGGQHTVAVTDHDDVYGFGSDRHGQLGLGQGGVIFPVPSRCDPPCSCSGATWLRLDTVVRVRA